MENKRDEGLRYNEGKLRYDLVHPVGHKGLVRVLTKGAVKYEPRNWEKGMSWTSVIASLERHLAAFKSGEDYDPETGEFHVDHLQCNAHFLSTYYKTAPHFDDRPHSYLNPLKIGLDIDEVLADWIGAYKQQFDYPEDHEFGSWYVDYEIINRCNEFLLEEFYEALKPKIDAKTLKFEPHCYITSRKERVKQTTLDWLHKHGFPCKPLYIVPPGESKVKTAKEAGVDVFVDDVYQNFLDLNQAGVCCYLFDAPHNRTFNVGYKRIKDLNELI